MAETSRLKRVLLSILNVTIYPSKDTEKYIADDEAVRSNIKLLINKPLEDKRPRLREADSLSLESLRKNKVNESIIGSLSGVPATSIREARLVLAPEATTANS